MYVVYALIDPRDNTVRYVGITDDVYARFLQHIKGMDENYGKSIWIQELRALNKMVIMETLEECETNEEACERESYWIRHFEMLKEPLMNISKMSSPRKATRTNLRLGRNILLDFAKATIQASGKSQQRALPVYKRMPAQYQYGKPITESDVQLAIEAWRNGADSVRKLEAALSISNVKARKLRMYLISNNLV